MNGLSHELINGSRDKEDMGIIIKIQKVGIMSSLGVVPLISGIAHKTILFEFHK